MRVLKISPNAWNNASRDKRELAVYRSLGAETIVMAKGAKKDRLSLNMVDGFEVYRCSTRPWGNWVPNFVNRLVSVILWSHYARKLHPNVISGHDIIALFIGWLSNCGRGDKAKLIYDSHEFEIGRNVKRGWLRIQMIKYLERFLIRRCVFSIMVNDCIADKVQQIHHLKERPIVVRNIPNKWELDSKIIQSKRKKLCQIMRIPENTFLVMYHGYVFPGRGIENILDTVAREQKIACIILGDGDYDYQESLKIRAEKLHIAERILFHPAVPLDKLKYYIASASVGLITLDLSIKSYFYSLPNKFFENIQALTPLIIYDMPEMRRIIEQYNIGLICKENTVDGICECIDIMRNDKELYQQFKKNLLIAKDILCWENESRILGDAWKRLIYL